MVRFHDRLRTIELPDHVGSRVTVAGWVHARRRLGGITFVVLRDGWGQCQLVFEDDETLAELTNESPIAVRGTVVAEPRAPGGLELRECACERVGESEPPPFVLGKKTLNLSPVMLFDLAAIAFRHPSLRSVARVSAAVMRSFRETLEARGFTEIATPKILGGASEGGANVFEIDYFGRRAYLAQSPQLYKQMMVGVFERVFEVGPVFRAEPHDTPRHLNQYTSLDAELGFIDDHRDVMDVVGAVVVEAISAAEEALGRHPESGSVAWEAPRLRRPLPSVSFWEATEIIAGHFGRDVRGEGDLTPQDERDLGEWARERFGSDFLFVTGYPLAKRPFYTHPDPRHPGYSNSFDLLFRGMEIVTGGQRLHTYADYVRAMNERGMSREGFEAYLAAFRYGMPPHGGFAMGLERFVAQLLGLSNVREAAVFPRTMSRLTP